MSNGGDYRVEDVSLEPSYWDVPVSLPTRRFNQFSRKMDRQLRHLRRRFARRHVSTATRRSCGVTGKEGLGIGE